MAIPLFLYECKFAIKYAIKLLKKLTGEVNRNAKYRCCVTSMLPNGMYYQEFGESEGKVAEDISGKIAPPYFYSVFVLTGSKVAFNCSNV